MSEFNLIKSVRDYEPKENKPDIDYESFEVIVEGQKIKIGIPERVAKDFFETIVENNASFSKRQFRKLMREYRGVRQEKE